MADDRAWQTGAEMERVELIKDEPELKIFDATLAPGQSSPWHCHSNVVDHFVVLDGRLHVIIQEPPREIVLNAGEHCEVPPTQVHSAINRGARACRFISLLGGRPYDFIPRCAS